MTRQEELWAEYEATMKRIQRQSDILHWTVIIAILSILPIIAVALSLLPLSMWAGGK